MAVIHKTTLTPTKLELLASWLPTQPWYAGTEHQPELAKAGGFRLDDPQGEVGIEFMVVTDDSGDAPLAYHVPVTYRAAPLAGAEQFLIGTSEHGVLGRRWVYDGTGDPVLLAELLALLQGRVEAQAQSETDTPDLSVESHFTGGALSPAAGVTTAANGPHGTGLVVETTAEAESPGESARRLALHVVRVLGPKDQYHLAEAHGSVTADWGVPGGDKNRGPFVVVRDEAS